MSNHKSLPRQFCAACRFSSHYSGVTWFKSTLRYLFFRLLCSVYLSQKVSGNFVPKTQKTGSGTVLMAIPKPVFSDITVFRAVSAPKTPKLPDLSDRQIRQFICVCLTLKMQPTKTKPQPNAVGAVWKRKTSPSG